MTALARRVLQALAYASNRHAAIPYWAGHAGRMQTASTCAPPPRGPLKSAR
jgi:hypothetical protein